MDDLLAYEKRKQDAESAFEARLRRDFFTGMIVRVKLNSRQYNFTKAKVVNCHYDGHIIVKINGRNRRVYWKNIF